MRKKILFFGLVMFMAVDAFAGTGDAYGAKPVFDKIDGALNDTYVSGLLSVGFLWKALTIHGETQDMKKAAPSAVIGVAIGSLGAIALGISGATFL